MEFIKEIRIFLSAIIDWLWLMVIFTLFFFSFNLEPVEILGRVKSLPVVSNPSFAADVFSMMVADLVPSGVPIIVTSPISAFVVQIKISLFLALVFTLPFLLYRLISYLMPALYEKERSLLKKITAPSILLFVGGLAFAYVAIVPNTFDVLYTFAGPIGVTTFLSIDEFVGLTLALMLTTGLSFTLPVLMVVLTAAGFIKAQFWRQKARVALVSLLVVSAIITPDGSGVSMLLLALPVSALYGAGAFVATKVERQETVRSHLYNN